MRRKLLVGTATALTALALTGQAATPKGMKDILQGYPEAMKRVALAEQCSTFMANVLKSVADPGTPMAMRVALIEPLADIHKAALFAIAVMSLPEATPMEREYGHRLLKACAMRVTPRMR